MFSKAIVDLAIKQAKEGNVILVWKDENGDVAVYHPDVAVVELNKVAEILQQAAAQTKAWAE